MSVKLPCEIIGRYFLPALRKELTRYLVKEKRVERKNAAEILGLTQAALSQYLHKKRGKSYRFTKEQFQEIKRLGNRLIKDHETKKFISGACRLCKRARQQLFLCSLHSKKDPRLTECDFCAGIKV